MAIQLTVKEGNSERSWDVIDGQQIDIRMSKGAQYALLDTHTGEAPDGLRVVEDHGQTKIYGSDNYPWVTLRGEDEDDSEAATTNNDTPPPAAAALAPAENIALADAAPADKGDAPADAEHVQAEEVAEPTNPGFEGTPSGTSMLLAGGGALLAGGLAAAIGGGSSGGGGARHYDEDTSFAPRPSAGLEPVAADGHGAQETTNATHGKAASATHDAPYTFSMNEQNLNFDNLLKNGKFDASNHRHDDMTLNAGDLLAHPSTRTLDGDYGDHLNLSGGGWTRDNIDPYSTYSTYRHGSFTLRVEDDISVSII